MNPFFRYTLLLALIAIANALPILRRVDVSSTISTSSAVPTFNSATAIPSINDSFASTTVASVTGSAAPVPTVSSTPNSSNKFVVAHHMVGNTFPYTKRDWADDITLAASAGIDGFALNMGRDEWQPARVKDAYDAASESGLEFKMFLSLDMTSLPCASQADASSLQSIVASVISHPAQMLYSHSSEPLPLISTFAGSDCTFGASSSAEGWSSLLSSLPKQSQFIPSFFVEPSQLGSDGTFGNVIQGDFNWNGGWPVELTTDVAKSLVPDIVNSKITTGSAAGSSLSQLQNALSKFIGSTETDKVHLNAIGTGANGKRDGESKTYIASVSPWFYTHYGKDTFNKNFVYLSDQHLYAKRWESLVSLRDSVDIVEVISWNDYGESHYVGPIKGAQPNSNAWVDGFEHTGWLEMTSHYAQAFKTGSTPAVSKDKIILWSRPHSVTASSSDPVGPPTNFELYSDIMWAVVMTTSPATVILSTDGGDGKSFEVEAGLNKLSLPISAGGSMYARVERNGATAVELKPEFEFKGDAGDVYNFNAFVASAVAE